MAMKVYLGDWTPRILVKAIIEHPSILAFILAIGFCVYAKLNKAASTKEVKESFNPKLCGDDLKMVLVVRRDLSMGKGKIAAQCAHAAVGIVEDKIEYSVYKEWRKYGSKKIVVKADSEKDLIKMSTEGQKAGLATYIVHDAGKTQIEPGTMTVLALGPGSAKTIDSITGRLQLL